MKGLLSVPLRILLPVLLLGGALLAGLISWRLNTRLLAGEIESQFLDEATLRITNFQANLGHLLSKGDAEGADLQMSALASRKDVLAAYVLDPQDRILLATDAALVGHSAKAGAAMLPADLQARHLAHVAEVGASARGAMELSQGRKIVAAYYPLQMNADSRTPGPARSGLVVLVFDMLSARVRAFNAAGRQAFSHALLFGGLAVCAWGVMHFRLSRRVARLVATTQQLASGVFTARTGILGCDELANVAKAVDQMADRIAGDILQRRQGDAELRASVARMKLIVKSSNIGLWDWNLVTNDVYFSPEWKSQLGYTDAELPNRLEERESRMHPEDREPTLAVVNDYLAGRRTDYEVECRMRHKDGSWRWLLTRANPIRDGEGQPVRLMGCHIDITERKRAEAELTATHAKAQASEQRMRVILDTHPECVKLIAADGTLLEVNPAGLRLIEAGHSAAILGRCIYDVIAGEHLAMFQALNEAVFRGESRTAEFEIIGLKGTRRWMQTHACPLRDAEGKIIAQLSVSRDISERKRGEAELEKAHRELVSFSRQAGMAEVATSVLHNVGNVLNSVNVSLEVASGKVRGLKSRSLEQLAALLDGHSGDLPAFFATDPQGAKLPAFLAQLSMHFTREQAALLRELDGLRTNVEHINEIVATQQSHATGGGAIETVRVADLVETALSMNDESLARHSVSVVREFAEVPALSVDKHKLMQILVNLIRNGKQACSQAEKCGRRITLRIAGGAASVKISVGDNGVGIAPENLARIFNHGFTTKSTGHGFGLHSAANAAGEMGGTLRADSAGPGLGATFTIELPCVGGGDAS